VTRVTYPGFRNWHFNFAKAGTQTFTGGGTITGAINWTVNDGSILDTGASTIARHGHIHRQWAWNGNGQRHDQRGSHVNGTLSPAPAPPLAR